MSSEEEENFSPSKKKGNYARLRIEEEDDDDSSSTGDSVVGNDRRKKCCQIESDEESGSSNAELDDSGVNVQSGNEDEESSEDDDTGDEDNDSDNWEDIEEDAQQGAADSDASDGQSEKCAICLNRFLGQDIGVPESCDHPFCLECLLEWTKKINTCPVDRQVFSLVLVKLELDGKVIRRVAVETPGEEPEEDEELTYCEVCARSDREDRLLLCDACDLAYHCECLDPPLDTIPVEEWYCPNCTPAPSSGEEEIPEDLLDEFNELLASRFRPQTVRRAIARTRASETVRSRIQRRRTAVEPTRATSSVTSRPPVKRKVVRRRRRTKRRTKRRKQKTVSGKGGTTKKVSSTTTKKKRKTRRRRKGSRKYKRRGGRTRRAIQAARPLVCPTVKKRIAERLGLQKPPPGHTMPLVRQSGPARPIIPDTGFVLFGDRDELHSFEGVYEEDGGDVSAVRVTPAHRRAPQMNKDILTRNTSVPYPSSFDLLGSILQTQSVLHSTSVNVKIGWDGSLIPSNTTVQCPLDPGSESSDPLPNRTHTKSCAQSPSDGRYSPTEPTTCSSGGDNSNECADSAEVASYNDKDHYDSSSDGHGQPPEPVRSPKPHPNKETNKATASDDDIDIYSDIESISNDTPDDMYCADSMAAERCEQTSPMDHQPVADSSEDELIIDEEAAHPDSEREESNTPTKNGLVSPEEEEEEAEEPEDEVVSEVESVADREVEEIDVCGFESRDVKSETPDEEDEICEEAKDEAELGPASPEMGESGPASLQGEQDQPNDDESSENSNSNLPQEPEPCAKIESDSTSWTDLDPPEQQQEDHNPKQDNKIEMSEIEPKMTTEKESTTVRKEGRSRHVDEDDVITAKVGSPISENEEAGARVLVVENTTHSTHEGLEEGEIMNSEEVAEVENPSTQCYSTKLEGVEDVSEAGSDDNQLEEDDEEKEEEEEGEETKEEGACEETAADVDMDEVEAKVAQLFQDDSKQQQSEEEEGLCESEPEDSPEPPVQAQTTQKISSFSSGHHSSSANASGSSRSFHRHREHSTMEGSSSRKSETEISWKKLSKSTKERSYRDGKLRDERVLFRERELKDKEDSARNSRKRENGCRHTRKEEERGGRRGGDTKRGSGTSGSSKSKYKETSRHDTNSGKTSSKRHSNDFYERHDKKWGYEKQSSSSVSGDKKRSSERHRTEKSTSSSSKHKHKDYKYDQYSSKYDDSDKHYKYEQQVAQVCEEVSTEKRRREKRKDREVRKVENKIIVEKKSSKEKKKSGGSSSQKKKKRTPSPVSDVSDVESKEIYSKGGSIIINVNYNRNTAKESSNAKHSSSRESSKRDAKEPVIIQDEDSDSWAATDAKNKSNWDEDDEIQIVCEKQGNREKRPTTPPPAPPKRKKEDSKLAPPKPSAFDMFWRDVEDISQEGKEEQEELKTKERTSEAESVPEENSPKAEQETTTQSKTSSPEQPDASLNFSGMFKKQPRSPSPPSPSDDESYDPCRPTSSPSPKTNSREAECDPKPPPEPILPPLPSEPEPRQPSPPPPIKAFGSPQINSAGIQQHPFVANAPSAQFSNSPTVMQSGGHMAMPNIRVPPPNFMSPAMGRSPAGLVQALRPWPMANGPPPMIFQPSQIQHVIRGSFMGHGGLQPSQMAGMIPHPAGNHLAMMRPPIGGPTMLASPATAGTGPHMQTMLMPDLSHPPPPLMMQSQPTFSVSGASVVPTSTTVVTSVPLLVPIVTVAQPSSRQDVPPVKEGSDSVVDMEVESPYSPMDSPGADLADEPSPEPEKRPSTPPKEKDRFDALLEAVPRLLADKRTRELLSVLRPKVSSAGTKAEKKGSVAAAATSTTVAKADSRTKHRHKASKRKGIAVKMKESQLKILDELPSSAVEMQVKEKFLKKLNRQERVVEEVKHALKPFYNKRDIDKLEYKSILRKCVPKICHNKTGEINPVKIKSMVEGYVRKYKHGRKKNLHGDS